MVRICEDTYPEEREIEYKHHFNIFPFPLSPFQKYAIESIVTGNHILVTAHTGSGKSLPVEFAIQHFTSQGKKVIYTSPIKSLSNQKFYEFTQKYPHISCGILTGDIKINPTADVLIMTAEILLNTLYKKYGASNTTNSLTTSKLLFDMDFENELACVCIDECHFINEKDRGKVYEETIMMLPGHIQMVMLSATIDSPEKFACWCENKANNNNTLIGGKKEVYLASTYERIVPLTNYTFITCNSGIFKTIKDKALETEIKGFCNKLQVIQDSKSNFNDSNFKQMKKYLDLFEDKKHFVKRGQVLNQVCSYMVEHNMLPALCFILSKKAIEQCANEITVRLLEDDSKVTYVVRNECEQIIRKLPNYQEYLGLPEYNNMIALLEKGIAIHHSGVCPILREIVELLYAKGYIKLLFATETFAVGLNMPCKTVLFTDNSKFDGNGVRILYSHEFTQMLGRAGRRGLDTVGHCIHLNNLFRQVDYNSYRTMMNGKPQKLISKFKISYNLLLNLINNSSNDSDKNINELIVDYAKRSMIQYDLDNKANGLAKQLAELEADSSRLEEACKTITIPSQVMDDYARLTDMLPYTVNKKRKECERDLKKITDEYKNIANERAILKKFIDKKKEIVILNKSINDNQYYLDYNVDRVLHVLSDEQLLDNNNNDNNSVSKLTIKGQIAASIRELPCLPFASLIEDGSLNHLDEYGLIAVFSCFTNVAVGEEWSTTDLSRVNNVSDDVVAILKTIDNYCERLQDLETRLLLDTGVDYSRHYNMIEYATEWAKATNEEQCKWVLQLASEEKDIFLGEFVKAILKIVAVCAEMEAIAEMLGQVDFLYKLRQIPTLLLKYVATNQSLYI